MSKKSKAPTKGIKVTKEFDFNLTREECAEKGLAAAALGGEVIELGIQFDDVKETWKAKINVRQSKILEIQAVLRAKKEKRSVECLMEKDYEEKEIRYWFDGELMEKRTMTAAEAQMEMGLKEKNSANARAVKQKLQKSDPVEEAHAATANGKAEDIANVRKLETSKHTKHSSVDGTTGN